MGVGWRAACLPNTRTNNRRMANSKYLLTFRDASDSTPTYGFGYYSSAIDAGLSQNNASSAPVPYSRIGSILSTSSAADMQALYFQIYNFDFFEIKKGTLLRDLNQSFEYTIDGSLTIKWTLVARVSDPSDVFYVATYVADQTYYAEPVVVLRTG